MIDLTPTSPSLGSDFAPSRGPSPEARARTVLSALLAEPGSFLRAVQDEDEDGNVTVLSCKRRAALRGPDRGRILGSVSADVLDVLVGAGVLVIRAHRTQALTGRLEIDYAPSKGATLDRIGGASRSQSPNGARPNGRAYPGLDAEAPDLEEIEDEEPEPEPTALPTERHAPPTPEPMPTQTLITLPPIGGEIPRNDLAEQLGLTDGGLAYQVKAKGLTSYLSDPSKPTSKKLIRIDDALVSFLEARGFAVEHETAPGVPAEPPIVHETAEAVHEAESVAHDLSGDSLASGAEAFIEDAVEGAGAWDRLDLATPLLLLRDAAIDYADVTLMPESEDLRAAAERHRAAVRQRAAAIRSAITEAEALVRQAERIAGIA